LGRNHTSNNNGLLQIVRKYYHLSMWTCYKVWAEYCQQLQWCWKCFRCD